MRLRALRKLEEIEIRAETERLEGERKDLQALLGDEALQWTRVDREIAEVKTRFGPDTELGRRRTVFAQAPASDDIAEMIEEALIVREPITVVLSEKGWLRALKGHVDDLSMLKHKDGDDTRFAVKAETTDKLVLFATDGRFFTLDAAKLPGGRGFGEPLRLSIELAEDAAIVSMRKHDPDRMLLVASTVANGFRIKEADVLAAKRAGRQVMNLPDGAEALCAVEAKGDRAAVIGHNRKLLVFALDDIPEMARGKGVRLLGGKAAELADITTFDSEEGLSWTDSAGRNHGVEDWTLYEGKRAQAGRVAPRGFSKANRFAPR